MTQKTETVIELVRTFKDPLTDGFQLGVGEDGPHWFVYTRVRDTQPWLMHCGPYADREQAVDWCMGVRGGGR